MVFFEIEVQEVREVTAEKDVERNVILQHPWETFNVIGFLPSNPLVCNVAAFIRDISCFSNCVDIGISKVDDFQQLSLIRADVKILGWHGVDIPAYLFDLFFSQVFVDYEVEFKDNVYCFILLLQSFNFFFAKTTRLSFRLSSVLMTMHLQYEEAVNLCIV